MSQILPSGTATVTAGNSSVTVTHTLGYAPDVNKIFLQAASDLGGVYFLPCTNPTATTFDINLSSIVMSNVDVNYIINQVALGTILGTITTATVDAVKKILTIPDTDTSYNVEIAECIVSSDAYVVSLLGQAGLTMPATIPQNLIDASNYYAAWMFRKRRDVQSAWIFFLDAEKFKDAYINGYLISNPSSDNDLPIAIGTDDS